MFSNQSNHEIFSETLKLKNFDKLKIVPKINLDSSIGTTQRNTKVDSFQNQSIDKHNLEKSISRN